jgi:RNA polymerase sigma-70 factor (ECF subfamily)
MADDKGIFLPTRRSLLLRLKNLEDNKSWREFFDTYWNLLYGTAIKAGLSDAEAQDVVQETIIGVANKMPEFQYDRSKGTFKGWLLTITRRRIVDQLRKRQPVDRFSGRHPQDSRNTPLEERIPDPASLDLDAVWDEEWQKNLLEAAIQRAKKRVDDKHWQIFDLCVNKEWPVEKIVQTLGVPRAQVYLIKHRVTKALQKEVKRLEAETK